MINEDQLQWDKENGVEYAAYTMRPIGCLNQTISPARTKLLNLSFSWA